MRVVCQRVSRASVTISGETVGRCGQGLLLLVGVEEGDTEERMTRAAGKVARLRVFGDDAGRSDRSLLDLGGGALVVSQFTLLADTSKGNRPSFTRAAAPEIAEPLVELFAQELRSLGVAVETGRFGAYMAVELVNDGPVTIVLEL